MSAEALESVPDDDLVRIAREVWSFAGLQPRTAPERPPRTPADAGTMCGVVALNGSWRGSVTVECSLEHARAAAGAMFGAEPGALSREELADALGELTNMVAGAVKSLLPEPSDLSVPAVSEGIAQHLFVPGADLLRRVHLHAHDGAVVRISVWRA